LNHRIHIDGLAWLVIRSDERQVFNGTEYLILADSDRREIRLSPLLPRAERGNALLRLARNLRRQTRHDSRQPAGRNLVAWSKAMPGGRQRRGILGPPGDRWFKGRREGMARRPGRDERTVAPPGAF
jgi:hypothetical protein